MAKFTFIYEDDNGTESTMQFKANTWFYALDQFAQFLKGCGYSLNRNSIFLNKKYNREDWFANITAKEMIND